MRASTFLALFGASLLVAACTNDVNLGDGDAGDGGGAGGTAGQAGVGGSQAGAGGSSTGGKGGTAGGGGTGGTGACQQGYADCDGNTSNGCEANLWTSSKNCGACGVVCPSGSSCASGKCTGDVDAGCANSQQCPAGQVCVANQCVADEDAGDAPACQSPSVQCQDGCKDIDHDALNCGACGQVCASGQVCSSGACTVDQDSGLCDAGWADCDGITSNGCETNIYSNALSCGACGQACAAGQICVAAVCTSDQDGGDAPYCANTSECGSGEICVNNACVPDGDAADAGPATCDPFTNTGCSSPYACVVGVPYYTDADIYCFPSGNTPADAACNPQALCVPGTTCLFEDPYGNGHCRKFCDYGGGVHGCPNGETCKSILHPTIGVCTP